jgi:hypothetical protein
MFANKRLQKVLQLFNGITMEERTKFGLLDLFDLISKFNFYYFIQIFFIKIIICYIYYNDVIQRDIIFIDL